jgi:hypothetical protein
MATTEQAVYDTAVELVKAREALLDAGLIGAATQGHRDRVATADQAWTAARDGRLEAGRVTR